MTYIVYAIQSTNGRIYIGQTGDESWVVVADPEGNEFCVLRSLAPEHFSL